MKVYELDGTVKDIESLNRLRSWMEDEVRSQGIDFDTVSLYTSYLKEADSYQFTLKFFK